MAAAELFVPPEHRLPPIAGLPIHVFGIHGRGMRPLALAAASVGAHVDGCDVYDPGPDEAFERASITVAAGHAADHTTGRHLVVTSTARPDEPEVVAARDAGRLHHRSDLLDAVLRDRRSVAVTGSHGKGTVTALGGSALAALGLDPMVVVGVDVPGLGGSFRAGTGPAVAEVDDADGSVARVRASISVITNSFPDHPVFGRTRLEVAADVARHAAGIPTDGRIVIGRARNLVPIVRDAGAPVWRLGRDFEVEVVGVDDAGPRVRLHDIDGAVHEARLRLHGGDLVDNAALAFAALRALGVAGEDAAGALSALDGLRRRVERLGRPGGVQVFDDLGKHPDAVAATIAAVRATGPTRLHVLYEPFLHADVLRWRRRWAGVLGAADSVVLLPVEARQVFAVRRRAPRDWAARAGLRADLARDRPEAVTMLLDRARSGDAVLVLGCVDDLSGVARAVVAGLEERASTAGRDSVPAAAGTES